MPLASARVKFSEAKRKLDHGGDPGALAKAEKLAEREAVFCRGPHHSFSIAAMNRRHIGSSGTLREV
jgi:hypothetical protein